MEHNTHIINTLRGGGAIFVNRSNLALRARQYWHKHNTPDKSYLISTYVFAFQFDFTISELSNAFLVTPRTCRNWLRSAMFYYNHSDSFRTEAQGLYDFLLDKYKYIIHDSTLYIDGTIKVRGKGNNNFSDECH